jgi:endoglucanase
MVSNYRKDGNVADLDGDNKTTLTDLSILITNYGKVYTPPVTNPPTTGEGRSIKGQSLYVYKPGAWASRPRAIYDYQVGSWGGPGEVDGVVDQATAAGKLALFVTYNIPGRDCGSYSAGGAGSSGAFRGWIDSFVNGVGNRKAIIILEPDALSQMDCLSGGDQATRLADLSYAVDAFKNRTQASVYIDAGNADWIPVATITDRLKRANIAKATGFALNVSNFKLTSDSVNYGERIVTALGQQGVTNPRYVIDTSRNGRGALPQGGESWCNPPGRGLGKHPTTSPDAGEHNDAYLWVKPPGESDGTCNGGPGAGQWYPSYAQMLIDNAVY